LFIPGRDVRRTRFNPLSPFRVERIVHQPGAARSNPAAIGWMSVGGRRALLRPAHRRAASPASIPCRTGPTSILSPRPLRRQPGSRASVAQRRNGSDEHPKNVETFHRSWCTAVKRVEPTVAGVLLARRARTPIGGKQSVCHVRTSSLKPNLAAIALSAAPLAPTVATPQVHGGELLIGVSADPVTPDPHGILTRHRGAAVRRARRAPRAEARRRSRRGEGSGRSGSQGRWTG